MAVSAKAVLAIHKRIRKKLKNIRDFIWLYPLRYDLQNYMLSCEHFSCQIVMSRNYLLFINFYIFDTVLVGALVTRMVGNLVVFYPRPILAQPLMTKEGMFVRWGFHGGILLVGTQRSTNGKS